MKQIIPFQKELLFKTKVSEITSISLEHTLTLTEDDIISGQFHISGDYKMTEGSINREKFEFNLPFDIALDARYDTSSMIIDIDNFYYEVVNNESLKVNIDVYVEGEKIEEEALQEEQVILKEEQLKEIEEVKEERKEEKELLERSDKEVDSTTTEKEKTTEEESEPITKNQVITPPEITIDREEDFEESIQFNKPNKHYLEEDKTSNNSMEFNIFENIDNSDTYVTYHVYIVKENDTIDKIIDNFGVTKEDIALYNDIEEIKTGTKLIIPNTNE